MYKGNVGVLEKMLSKFYKTHVFVFAITWPSLIQIELFKFLGKLDFYENKSPLNKCIQIWTPLDLEICQSETLFSGKFWFSLVHFWCFGIVLVFNL